MPLAPALATAPVAAQRSWKLEEELDAFATAPKDEATAIMASSLIIFFFTLVPSSSKIAMLLIDLLLEALAPGSRGSQPAGSLASPLGL